MPWKPALIFFTLRWIRLRVSLGCSFRNFFFNSGWITRFSFIFGCLKERLHTLMNKWRPSTHNVNPSLCLGNGFRGNFLLALTHTIYPIPSTKTENCTIKYPFVVLTHTFSSSMRFNWLLASDKCTSMLYYTKWWLKIIDYQLKFEIISLEKK